MKRKKNRCTGFPSPAADFEKSALSLDELLIHNPSATFFMKMKGRAMVLAGIYPNDILIIDRSLPYENEDVVVAIINNQYVVRRWMKYQNGGMLLPANPAFPSIKITDYPEGITFWGVVAVVIHQPDLL